jgi:protein HOOK3
MEEGEGNRSSAGSTESALHAGELATGQHTPSAEASEILAPDANIWTMSDIDAEAQALLSWVQAIERGAGSGEDTFSKAVHDVEDLYDGIALFEVLSTVDPAYFRNPHQNADAKDNWVLKTATLKRLYKLLTQYYMEVLEQSIDALAVPDLDLLARDGSRSEICKLGRLALGIAVRSDKASEHIGAIQSLAIDDQQQIMYTIEQVMSSLQPLTRPEDQQVTSVATDTGEDARFDQGTSGEDIRQQYSALLERHAALQTGLDDVQSEKEELSREFTRYKEEVERERHAQADVLMRQEIERLKADLRRSEDNFAEAESEVERLNASVVDLSKKAEELHRKTEENVKLKDQLEELKHASDKLQRTENVMEKYKKKLEEGSEVRRQLKILEQQNAELVDRNTAVEDEYKRVAHFKPLMDSYKGQIAELETKVSMLQRDLNAARYETEQTSVKLRATEEARVKEKEDLDLYQERVQELELRGGLRKRGSSVTGDAGKELSDDEVDERLEDSLSEMTMAGLKIQVRKLSRELRVAQSNKADAGRLLVVENLLQDANKMKARYERDYLKEYQTTLKLQKRIEAIQDGASKESMDDDLRASNVALRMRFNETNDEMERLQKRLKDIEVEYDEIRAAHAIVCSDLTLVDKDKLDMIEEVRSTVNVEKTDLERRLKQAADKVSEHDEQIRMQLSQINTLLLDKVDLQTDGIEQRDGALQRELEMNELRKRQTNEGANVAEERLKTVEEKLQKARAFIRQQDKMLQEATSKKASNGLAEDDQGQVRKLQRENEILRQEQRLMLSAWYDLNHRLTLNMGGTDNARLGGGGGAESGTGAGLRAQTKASVELHGLKPKSWLRRQRAQLTGGIMLARR